MNMKFIPFSKIELSLYRNSVFLSSLLVNTHFSTYASINHALIHYWNQPGLSHEGEVSCSRKPCAPLMGFELMACSSPLNHTHCDVSGGNSIHRFVLSFILPKACV